MIVPLMSDGATKTLSSSEAPCQRQSPSSCWKILETKEKRVDDIDYLHRYNVNVSVGLIQWVPVPAPVSPLVKSISKVLSRGRTGEVQDRITLMRTSRDV